MSDSLKMIPLGRLNPSPTNVRKTDTLADIEPLAASIAASGLLENLVVRAIGNTPTKDASYEVVAGGRRLAALRLLAERETIKPDHRVACLVIAKDDTRALEISLAENFERVPVHPADQSEAFAALCEKGLSPDQVAARFGIATRFVEQRLKLACLSPRLVAEYRAGAMTLEQLTAFTLSDDHALQEEVWFERVHSEIAPLSIRRFLTQSQVDSQDPRARFIGAKAYEDAGGVIVRDLFDTEDEGYFGDSQLLDRLVFEKLQELAEPVRTEGWQWVEVRPDLESGALRGYGRIRTVEVLLSEDEEKHLSALAEQYDALVDALDDDRDGETPELDRISAEMEVLQAKKEIWPDDEKARAGVIVTLDGEGTVEIIRGLVKPEANSCDKEGGRGESPRPHHPRKEKNGYSEGLIQDLSAHFTQALRERIAQKPDVAFLLLLRTLVGQLFYGSECENCLGIRAQTVDLERLSETVKESKAASSFRVRHADWTERLPDESKLGEWLADLDETDRHALLAHCIAMTMNTGGTPQSQMHEDAQAIARTVGLDMREWWRPTRANFLDRLTKSEIVAAVTEGVSQQAAWRLEGLKKDRMASEAEKLLENSGWLPMPLRVALPQDVSVPEL